MSDLVVLAGGWLIVLVIFLGFLSLRRYLEHRERMAMILRGITPPDRRRNPLTRPRFTRRAGVLQGGLITAMVGLALTLGLYPIGFLVPPSLTTPNHLGPWLLAGLIPLAVGIALILGHYLTPGRPVDLPAGEHEGQPAGQDGLDQQRTPTAHSSEQAQAGLQAEGEPLAFPEMRRWMLYRREPINSSDQVEVPPDEQAGKA
jgi:hypothetical protein